MLASMLMPPKPKSWFSIIHGHLHCKLKTSTLTSMMTLITQVLLSPPQRTMSRNYKVRNGMPFGDLPIAIKVRLYKCTVLSVLTYGSETWTLTESRCDKLNTFQLNCLRVMLGISRRDHVTNDLCHLRSKDGSSASLATHFAATRRIISTDSSCMYHL